MRLDLSKVNPEFRILADLIFFTDRMDLDFDKFKKILLSNNPDNLNYLLDRIKKSSQISWEPEFWNSRFSFLLLIKENKLSEYIFSLFENNFYSLLRVKSQLLPNYDKELLQFLELCKVKSSLGEDLSSVKNTLHGMVHYMSSTSTVKLINLMIPVIYSSFDEYIINLCEGKTLSRRHVQFLSDLDKLSIRFNKDPIYNILHSVLLNRSYHDNGRAVFFFALSNEEVFNIVKKNYDSNYQSKIIELLKRADLSELEENHCANVKNIIKLDPSLIDPIYNEYLDKLYDTYVMHRRAHARRIIKLIKNVPQISSKKILAWLSNNNKTSDIKFILNAFPELKKLALFA